MDVGDEYQVTAQEQLAPEAYSDSFEAAPSVVMIDDPGSITAEGLGSLRTQLITRQEAEAASPVAVCAASKATGATFIAVNLAVAMAQVGTRTLLIDADMREPGVQEMIIPPHDVPGLRHYLADEAGRGDVVQESIIPNLSIIYAGGVAANPQELLSTGQFKELIDFGVAEYDMVILDTPPANHSSDSRYIAAVVGLSLVVARKNHSLISDVKTLVDELARNDAKVIGTVLADF